MADQLDASVTHVIAQKDTSAKQASAKLETAGTHTPVLVRAQHCSCAACRGAYPNTASCHLLCEVLGLLRDGGCPSRSECAGCMPENVQILIGQQSV